MSGVALPFTAVTAYVNTIRRTRRRRCPAARRSSAASRASSAGTRWRWSSAPTATRTASAATSRPTPRRRRCTKSASTTSSAARARRRRRHHLLPGPRLARHLRARVPRRPAVGREARELPPRAARRAAACRRTRIPWLMPDFWEFPTVSMGLGPIMSIYQARFNRYLEDRGLKQAVDQQGLGVPRRRRDRRARIARRDHPRRAREARQPDLRHQLQPAAPRRPGARQRPDHPGARSDASAAPAGTSSRCSGAATGIRCSRAITTACSPSAWAKSSTASIRSTPSKTGAYIREHFFGTDPRLLEMVKHLSDEQLKRLRLGGHDPVKVYNAYKAAVEPRASRPSSSRARSRATASARRAKARTSPTSRRS